MLIPYEEPKVPEVSRSKIEKIHLFTQIFTYVMKSVAAIAVAFWGFYSTVYVKREKELAEYNLKELEQKTTQESHVLAKVDFAVQPGIDAKKILIVKVALSNRGNKETRVTLDNQALTLVPVTFNDGNPIFHKPISLRSGRCLGTIDRAILDFVDIGAGESHELTFAQQIENPGVYLIHFLAFNSTSPAEQSASFLGVEVPYRYSVGADQYVMVE